MSWIQKLYETYNNSLSMVGAGADDNEVSLLPICHTTQKAQIEIVLDGNGKFRRARVIPKDEARTIIEDWRIDYNRVRPHSSLDNLTPEEYAEQHKTTTQTLEETQL